MSKLPAALQVTKTVYRVDDFVSWQRAGQLVLRPEFQRGSVWSKKGKSYLVDSLLRGFPVPIIFLQTGTDPRSLKPIRRVVDGQQRLRTLLAYVDPKGLADFGAEDDFALLRAHNPDLAGRSFDKLAAEMQQRLLQTELSVHVLPADTPNAILLELFARLNSSGVRLNAQELRNAQFHGEFREICYRLAFERADLWIGWGIFSRPSVARMLEVELVSELLMFLERGLERKNQRQLDTYYRDREDTYSGAEEAIRRFENVFNGVAPIYQHEPTLTSFRNQSWFFAIFAAAYQAAYRQPIRRARARQPKVKASLRVAARLDQRLRRQQVAAGLLKALRGAAADKASRQQRIAFVSPIFLQ